ncbi:MAG: MATE family efflux transporter [Lachnospiraceae bacterium]|nr:MATE family efflux transporter [Lachnospiraceae bacterium]
MKNTKNMTVGKPAVLLLQFALPLMAGNLFQEFYTVADTIIVGQFLGVTALAAIGAGGWITWMMAAAIQGFTQGFSIPAAQAFGAGNKELVRKNMGNAAVMSVLLSVLLVVVGELILEPLLVLLDTPPEIFATTLMYLRIYYAACPVMMAYNYAACNLRALGNSQAPLQAMVLASIINIGLDLLFVGPFKWGVAGAVIATVIAQFFAAIYAMYSLFRIDFIYLTREDLRLQPGVCKKLLVLGAPMSLQNIIISIGGIIVQFIVNQFGITFIAGFTATNRLYGLIETAGISYGYAMTTYTGQNKGAGLYKRIHQGVLTAHVIGLITSVTISVIMIFFGKSILSLFITGTPAEILATTKVAYRYLFIMSMFLPILYSLHILRSSLMGLGNSSFPMFSGIAELIMRVASSFIIPVYFGEMNLFFAEPIAWAGAVIVLLCGYLLCMSQLPVLKK